MRVMATQDREHDHSATIKNGRDSGLKHRYLP